MIAYKAPADVDIDAPSTTVLNIRSVFDDDISLNIIDGESIHRMVINVN